VTSLRLPELTWLCSILVCYRQLYSTPAMTEWPACVSGTNWVAARQIRVPAIPKPPAVALPVQPLCKSCNSNVAAWQASPELAPTQYFHGHHGI
jgi:hypothetical protein